MNSRRWFRLTLVGVGMLLGLGTVTTAIAAPIGPGFDFFMTPPGGAEVDLGMGPIPLEGVPLPSLSLGLADTLVARMDPGPPEGGTAIIDIELVALHLKSVGPVDIDGPGGPAPFGDLHITIDASDRFFTGTAPHPDGTGAGPSRFNLPTLPTGPSIGNMDMLHDPPGPGHSGATMKACFGDPAGCAAMPSGFGLGLGVPSGGIFASAYLVIPGGDPADPMDVLASMPAPMVTLASMGTYVHTPFAPAQLGGLGLASIAHDGPHPNAQPVPEEKTAPEPSCLILVLLGLTGLVAGARQR